jgi:putative membrane protein
MLNIVPVSSVIYYYITSMKTVGVVLIAIIAFEHLYFLWLEMFAWETKGKEVFKMLPGELFKPTKTLAANQGLYNGFLAVGLVWTFFITDNLWRTNISIFFLSCVVIAGIYGALTATRKIFYIQALPAIIALVFTLAQLL